MAEFSLEDLTAQLQAVQEKKAVVRLSERNTVELVNKLKELKFLDSSLLHTSNGKEYLTRDRLRKEIEETLYSAGGRISLSELCSTLNVDLSHCERESAVVVEGSGGAVRSIQEELITEAYLDAIALEIKERLETMGMLRIGDLAIQYGLSHDLLLSVVSARLGSVLQGELLNSMLFTQAYMDRIKAQLRGAMNGATSPIALVTLLKHIQLEESGTADIIQKLVTDLIQDSHILGELRVNGQWVPKVHTKAQRASIVTLFNQSGFVAVAAVKKLMASESDAFIKESFADHCRLDSVVVAHSFVETIDAEIEENMEKGKWCDVSSLVPPDFSDEDVRLLLQQCQCLKRHHTLSQITDACLMQQSFLEECKEKVKEMAIQVAKEALMHSKKNPTFEKEPQGATKGKSDEVDEDDDWTMDKRKGKKKGGGKAKGKNKQTAGTAKQPSKAGKESMLMANSPTVEKLVEVLVEWCPDMEEVIDLPEAIAETLLSDAVLTYKETLEEAARTTDKRRQDLKDAALKRFEETLNKLWLFFKGLDALTEDLDEPTVTLLKKHLIKTTGSEALDLQLRYFQMQEPGADEGVPDELIPVPPNERSSLIEGLPPDVMSIASEALQSAKQDEPAVLLERLEQGIESCGVRLPKRDKKTEKQNTSDLASRWKESFVAEDNAAAVLALLLPLLVLQLKGVVLSLPGRAMPAVMEFLKPSMKAEDYELLEAFHKAVVEDLKQKSAPREENTTTTELNSTRETLADLLPKAKALV